MKVASPEQDFLPIILQTGDPSRYGSFEKFQSALLASKITINAKASELGKADLAEEAFFD